MHTSAAVTDCHSNITVEVLEFVPKQPVRKTVVNKNHCDLTIFYFEEGATEKRVSAYDTYAQVIDGNAELRIKDMRYKLHLGEGVIIPSGVTFHFVASKTFKVVFTVVKEDAIN